MKKNIFTFFLFTCFLWYNFLNAQPANDNCANAIQVTPLDGTCVQYTTSGATPDLNIASCPEGINNVWFYFDAVSTTADITVSGIQRPEIALIYFDPTPCDIGSAFEHDCVDGGGFYTSITMTATGLTIGTRYYIVVTTNNNTNSTFNLCVTHVGTPPPNCLANDLCTSPQPITYTLGNTVCVNGCTNGTTPGPDFTGNNCYDFPNGTVWYSITTTGTAATMDITLSSPVMLNPYFAVFTTSNCNTFTIHNCTQGAGGNASAYNINVSPNTTYLIAVSNDGAVQGDFQLCVTVNQDNSACNLNNSLVVTSTSMGSPLSGPYKPGEIVTFCYTISQWVQVNCNYLQGIVPTFGDCWDPTFLDPQGQPPVTVPLQTAGTITGGPCIGLPAGTWQWFPAGAVTYNNIPGPMANQPLPGGWYFRNITGPLAFGCVAPADPDDAWGDSNSGCNNNNHTWQVCFQLRARGTSACNASQTDCSVSIKTYADGEIGVWNNIGCTVDIPTTSVSVLCCEPAPTVSGTTICYGSSATLTITAPASGNFAWYTVPVGGTPIHNGSTFNTPILTSTTTYYVENAAPGCTSARTAVTVTVQPLPNAGTNGSLTICQGQTVTAAQLFSALGGTPDAGGTWTPAPGGAGTYTYTVNAVAPCTGTATAQVVVTEQAQPNAGTNGSLTICQGQTVTAAQLFAALGGTPQPGGTWTPAPGGAGTYTYTVNAVAPCTGTATAQVVVTEQPQPNAGTNGSLTICQGQTVTAAQLFAALGGTPDAGGTWTPAPGGAGTYTYTVNAVAPCTGTATAQVVVTEQPQPNAGTDGSLTICQGQTVTAAQLFAALGGTPDAGGTWTPAPGGAGTYTYTVNAVAPCTGTATAQVVVTETTTADAGTDGSLTICQGQTVTAAQLFAALGGTPQPGGTWSPALAGAGTYTYTVNAVAPCTGTATAQVVVTEQAQPNAGTDGSLTICQGQTVTAAQLFAALGGTPDAGGTWTPAPGGAGTYTYTVNAVAPCTGTATAQVVVTEQAQPNAGTNGSLTICQGQTVTAAQLFAALGGTPDAGGTWTPAPGGAGTYTYTVNAVAPCTGTATAQVVVTEQAQPNAGTNGSLTICQGQTVTAAQLFAALGGTPDAGGTWSPAPGGAGTYTYTVNAVPPCTGNATAQVVVTEQAQPNAGTNGSLTICQGQTVTAAQLFAALGGTPDAGGTWTPAPGGAGTYTYTVNAVAPCTGTATAQVVVTEQAQPNAGTNGSLTICQGQTVTAAQLFAALGGTPDAGGTWTPAPGGAGTYTYTVNAVAPCIGTATAQVVVTEQAQPNAGTNGSLTICQGQTVTAAQLFAALGGTPDAGGTWTPAPGGAGTYTYTVNAVAPCTGTATAQVVVTEQAQPNAGTNGTLTICQGQTVTAAQLFAALGGTPQPGGTWTPAPGGAGTYTYTVNAVAPCTGTATAQVVVTETTTADAGTDGSLTICQGQTVTAAQLFAALGGTPQPGGTWTPAPGGAGTYTYTVNAVAPCTGTATAQVVVTEQAQPNAGTNGSLTICQGQTVTAAQLFAALGGTPQPGGTWTPAPGGAGIYTYTVNAVTPCTGTATAQVVVTEQAQPNAGTNGSLTICQGQTVTAAQLFSALGGTPDAGGTWTPAPGGAGTYTYTVNAVAPCTGTATAQVVVTEQAQPNAGTNGSLTICQGQTVTAAQLFAALGGTPDAGGTWTPAPGGAGTYTYTVNAVAPCTGTATAQVFVTEQPQPNAGTNGSLTICQGQTVTAAQLFAALGGTPDAGGTWTPAPGGAGTYTYTVNAVAPCTGTATAQVVVTEQAQPNAGTNGSLTICQGQTVTAAQLFAALGGTPDAGGTWTPAPGGAGTYTYTVNAVAPCTGTATAQVVVTETTTADAGTDGSLTICQGQTVTAAQLFSALGGTPQPGGTWTPAPGGAGTYTYTVNAVAPCTGTASAQVVVTEQAQPNAGTNGSLTICQGQTVTAAQLFSSLGGTPQPGGTWTPAPGGAGTYTYTVNAVAPCTGTATAQVVVTETTTADAGTDGSLTICQGQTVTAAQLFSALGGTPQPGGTWTPAPGGAGTYTYTVNAVAPCTGTATAQVVVTETTTADAGTDGSLTICQGQTVTAAQLFAALGGTPDAGGTWTPAPGGAGTYTYTVNAVAPCTGTATAQVVVTEQAQPNAGTNGSLTICQGQTVTAAQLFAALGGTPDAGGTWTPAPGGAGTYTYTVNAVAPCTGTATAQVVVTEQAQPNAGTNGSLTICQGQTVTAAQLFAALGGTPDAGGTWTPAPGGAGTYTYTVNAVAPCTGTATAQVVVTETTTADAGTDGSLTICQGQTVTAAQLFSALGGTPQPGGTWTPAPGGAGTYTYTVNAVAPCTGTATAQVVVTEQAQPNAGTDGSLTICQGQTVTAAQLFSALGGTPQPGGTWTPAPGGAGTYTYTVNAVAPCTGTATSQVVVTEQPQPNAGTNGSLTICQGQTVTAAQLFAALGGTPQPGGTWTPAPGGAGTYTYTVNAVAPCTGTATAQVVVTETIVDAPIVSEPTICGGQSATLTVNNPTASYLWYDVSSGGTPIYNGVAFNTPNLTSNATYYVEAVANGCTSSRIPVNVFVQTVSSMNDTTVCIYDQLTLNGLPTGGIWLGVGITNNVFNASIAGVGSHLITYEFNGCTASFIITVEDTLIPNVVVQPSLPATVTLPQTEFNFTDQTLGAVQWHWNFGNGDTSNLSSVSIKYLQPGTYTVTLTIQNATGCISTVVLGPIIVEEGTFEVPNIFTPNGDGVNDVFQPKIEGYELKSMLIYDRWGNQLYSSDGNIVGWNGKLRNGSDAVDGVYNYVIELQKSDGTKYKRVGSVTLMR